MAADTKPYLHGHHASVLRSHSARTARNSCPHLLPHLRPDMRILDVGCGPGTITADLALNFVPAGHVTGVDYSAAVLTSARDHALQLGVQNIAFRQADAYALPFADGAFDVVTANQVVQHVTDPVAAVREMRRVCRPHGGIVALREGDAQVWYPDADGGPGEVLKEWYELWLRMAREGGMEPNTGRRLLSYALKAGCAREELEEWCGMWADRVLLSEFAENAVGRGYATKKELERMSKAWREFLLLEDSWYGMLQGEAIIRKLG